MSNTGNHVAIGFHVCPICLEEHSHNAPILLNKRLKDVKEEERYCGLSLCETHGKQQEDGYVFLIGVAPNVPKSTTTFGIMDAPRSGVVISMKKEVALEILKDAEFVDNIAFISQEAVDCIMSSEGASNEG